jgi:hypothetical protein
MFWRRPLAAPIHLPCLASASGVFICLCLAPPGLISTSAAGLSPGMRTEIQEIGAADEFANRARLSRSHVRSTLGGLRSTCIERSAPIAAAANSPGKLLCTLNSAQFERSERIVRVITFARWPAGQSLAHILASLTRLPGKSRRTLLKQPQP